LADDAVIQQAASDVMERDSERANGRNTQHSVASHAPIVVAAATAAVAAAAAPTAATRDSETTHVAAAAAAAVGGLQMAVGCGFPRQHKATLEK
jgi:hypothetical protein